MFQLFQFFPSRQMEDIAHIIWYILLLVISYLICTLLNQNHKSFCQFLNWSLAIEGLHCYLQVASFFMSLLVNDIGLFQFFLLCVRKLQLQIISQAINLNLTEELMFFLMYRSRIWLFLINKRLILIYEQNLSILYRLPNRITFFYEI